MPSLKYNRITVSITGVPDLLISAHTIQLPAAIPPGMKVRVDGQISAFICKQHTGFPPDEKTLQRVASITLRATFDRLARDLPEFHPKSVPLTSNTVEIRYPLQIVAPKTLGSVVKGESFELTWTVRSSH